MARRPVPHPLRRLCGALAITLPLLAAMPAPAATDQQNLLFSSAGQSLWGSAGPGGFGRSGYAIGNHGLGISYSMSASSGTVSSSVGGRLEAQHEASVPWETRGAVQVGLAFLGDAGAARFETDLGAHAFVGAHLNLNLAGVPIAWNPSLINADYRLDIVRSFTAALPLTATGADAFTPATVGIGLPTFGIGLAGGAGVDLDIRQNAQFGLTGLTGQLQARHRATGETVVRSLALADAGGQSLSFDLARAGTWDFSYLGLNLGSRFTTQFAMDMLAYVEYGVGVYCGDLGSDADNVLCTDDRLRAQLAAVNLFSSPVLQLAYGALDAGDAFSLTVLAAPVPEPAPLLTMLAGAAVLLARRRRLQAS